MSEVVSPEAVGIDPVRLSRLCDVIGADIDKGLFDGCVVLVGRNEKTVLHEAFGFAHRESERKMERDSVFYTMSAGKQFINALILNRIERGEIELTTQVREIIPEFAKKGKDGITLYHLLTHTSGLIQDNPPGISSREQMGNLELYVAATCATAPAFTPGSFSMYSAYAAHAVMAEVLLRLDGKTRSLRDYLAAELFGPLGMTNTALGKPDRLADQVCPIVGRGEELRDQVEAMNFLMTEDFEFPGGGYVASAVDLDRFTSMLRQGGIDNGFRLLSPTTLKYAAECRTGNHASMFHGTDLVSLYGAIPNNIGIGFFVRGTKLHPMAYGSLASPSTFGGMGHGSVSFWVDPDSGVSVTFMSTGLIDGLQHVRRCQRYSDIVHASVIEN